MLGFDEMMTANAVPLPSFVTRYWRLLAADISWCGDYTFCIRELFMMTNMDGTGTNVAAAITGTTASASSNYYAGGVGSANDGAWGGGSWGSVGNQGPQWFQIDLGAGRTAGVRSAGIALHFSEASLLPKTIVVQSSSDGSSWATVTTVRTTVPVIAQYQFGSVWFYNIQ